MKPYRYYLIPFSNIIHLAVEHPERYLMDDWIAKKDKNEIIDTIYNIEEMNNNFLKERRK